MDRRPEEPRGRRDEEGVAVRLPEQDASHPQADPEEAPVALPRPRPARPGQDEEGAEEEGRDVAVDVGADEGELRVEGGREAREESGRRRAGEREDRPGEDEDSCHSRDDASDPREPVAAVPGVDDGEAAELPAVGARLRQRREGDRLRGVRRREVRGVRVAALGEPEGMARGEGAHGRDVVGLVGSAARVRAPCPERDRPRQEETRSHGNGGNGGHGRERETGRERKPRALHRPQLSKRGPDRSPSAGI